jgi:hypothetical protein
MKIPSISPASLTSDSNLLTNSGPSPINSIVKDDNTFSGTVFKMNFVLYYQFLSRAEINLNVPITPPCSPSLENMERMFKRDPPRTLEDVDCLFVFKKYRLKGPMSIEGNIMRMR